MAKLTKEEEEFLKQKTEALKQKTQEDAAKAVFIVIALVLGFVAFLVICLDTVKGEYGRAETQFTFKFFALSTMVGIWFLYPVLGAIAVSIMRGAKEIAYPNRNVRDWNTIERLWLGAFWIVTLPSLLIVYVFLAIIHRVFDTT